ncbi:ABC transporter ATP-binding protein [Rhizobium sp. L1K21]|uniref:ABC transporter ATP-binding protein n=1 Tax=Rhizobium sp. L1K21 TaxID=2954933 RepID=UPI002092A295|nr:ABC transporter ATP-binding protein [Rhizobium sp. L1K21]MCO6188358.1 ABC transporter ATP-binding protein [Rhizobium sp. L1K21]
MADVTFLKTKDLKCHFGGIKAVDGVDFTLEKGEIRAIIGPNGAGKSTFVSLLSGRTEATAGEVEFLGENVTRLPAYKRVRRGIAYTFQITNIYKDFPVIENVAIAVQSRLSNSGEKTGAGRIRAEAEKVLARVGLSQFAERKAGELAYGHQRLLEVGMGLALQPELLILDEPTQGLSDSEVSDFCDLVKEIAQNATILLIEHNMDVVMTLAGRITVLNQGRILAEGSPEDIRANRAVQDAYLGRGDE